MAKDFTQKIKTKDSNSTEQVAESIGRRLKGGEIIELAGDLGSGKTTFVRGLVKGIGSTDHVASPTFTISRVYKTDKLSMHHMDFYRLEDVGIMAHEIRELVSDPRNIVVIEWADITKEALPDDRLTIRFTTAGETERSIEISNPPKFNYLIEENQ
jgi:tRNA threonylcarbamoyladenosine biosynthesis protein TsaE